MKKRSILLLVLAIVLLALVYPQRSVPLAGTGWVAKRVCSGVFVTGRPPEALSEASLPLPLPIPIPFEVDTDDRSVTAYFAGSYAPSTARFRPGLGCTLVGPGASKSRLDGRSLPRRPRTAALPTTASSEALIQAMDLAFPDPALTEGPDPQTRALVVVHRGQVIGERYAEGFSASTPLPGWSMTKSVTSAMVGLLQTAGKLDISAQVALDEWQINDDPRNPLTWDHLLRMSSGLSFSENYSLPNSDAIKMLFGSDRYSKGRYAAERPLEHEIDIHWSYSSGTTNLIQYALLERVFGGDLDAYLRFPAEALFGPLDMESAVLEPDESGVFVGSSHMFATARDWARFGLLFLNDGVVATGDSAGTRLLSREWIEYSRRPTKTNTEGIYGAHWWLNTTPQNPSNGEPRMPKLPTNIIIASGFEGQYIFVVPDHDLVVVRLGLDRGKRVDIESVVAEIVETLD